MASQDPSTSPGSPALSCGDGQRHFEPVSLDGYTFDKIIDYIVDAHHHRNESILSFSWPANQVHDLSERLDNRLAELDQLKIRRFEYNYISGTVYLDIMDETTFHYQVQAGLRDYLRYSLAELLVATDDTQISQLIRSIWERGTADIKYENKLCKQADVSFGQAEEKACRYIDLSDGKIRVVLILELQYSGMKKAWVNLLVADESSSCRVPRFELLHDDDLGLDQQPDGQVDLYLSDFLGLASLPVAFCRPSTAELATGVSRTPQIVLRYERLRAIVRRARWMHNPTDFSMEVGDDEEEHLYENVERRVAEARNEERIEAALRPSGVRLRRALRRALEAERRVAEARNEERIEVERRVAEIQQRIVDLERRGIGG
ncbi:hypothetical protein C8A00DRAFT_42278 [Chaetomidium leptoderma]|uniref:Uncharacterized protein n=1 Tax=Chaetomidium leptoderma TaxID=669021 RepID=A0AAN6ZWY6_9PEZI|nr:hypothetical protein C8A00DRAFT_42278 [Chaetomidium leptoderma]